MRFLLALSLLCASCEASYRVYKLRVRHFDFQGKPTRVESVLSNLDPYQYAHYHGGYGVSKVELVDTWYCPGDTSRKEYCKKPKSGLGLLPRQ